MTDPTIAIGRTPTRPCPPPRHVLRELQVAAVQERICRLLRTR